MSTPESLDWPAHLKRRTSVQSAVASLRRAPPRPVDTPTEPTQRLADHPGRGNQRNVWPTIPDGGMVSHNVNHDWPALPPTCAGLCSGQPEARFDIKIIAVTWWGTDHHSSSSSTIHSRPVRASRPSASQKTRPLRSCGSLPRLELPRPPTLCLIRRARL
jgi:hypothetical protein